MSRLFLERVLKPSLSRRIVSAATAKGGRAAPTLVKEMIACHDMSWCGRRAAVATFRWPSGAHATEVLL